MPVFGRLYHLLFYRKMVQREIEMAGLKPGEKVVHIGCGPLPLTACELAKHDLPVEAVDIDAVAAAKAENFLKRECSRRVEVKVADGRQKDYSSVQAAWFSLHVHPRRDVLQEAFASLPEGGKMVYRNPRGWATLFYQRVEPETIAPRCPSCRCRQLLGKETVVITKVCSREPTCR